MHKIHIQSGLNNTILTITDKNGNVLNWSSAGSVGFKNSQKSNNYAAQLAGQDIGKKCRVLLIKSVLVILKGVGYGKKPALLGLQQSGIKIKNISEFTAIPYNGCRAPKKRRT